MKKLVCVLSVTLLVLSMTACGKDVSSQAEEATPVVEQEKEEELLSVQEEQTPTDSVEGEIEEVNTDIPDPELKAALFTTMEGNVCGGTWSAYVCGLDSGSWASYNEQQMQAASLIKLYIFGAVYEHWDEVVTYAGGEAVVDSQLQIMINQSDNSAANSLTTYLGQGDSTAGRGVVNEFCASQGYVNTHMGRLLLESNAMDDNYTSAGDCAKVLQAAYNGTYPGGDQLITYMKQQTRTNKIPAGIPDGIETANKTGELGNVENDAAIVWAGGEPFVLCVVSEDLAAPGAAQSEIISIAGAMYDYFK